MSYKEYIVPNAWGLDFCRALAERPWWARFLARLGMGRYAHRELIGLRRSYERYGYGMGVGYGLEHTDYHQERVPFVYPGLVEVSDD